MTADWEAPYRARRLAELLEGGDYDLAGFAAIQADQRSLLAKDLLPIMLEAEALSAGGGDGDAPSLRAGIGRCARTAGRRCCSRPGIASCHA